MFTRSSRLLALASALSLTACHEPPPLEEPTPASPVTVTPEGLALSTEAQAFVHVEAASVSDTVSSLRVPARIAYRDGSVAEVSTPVAGRITELFARTGEVVEEGAPLLELRSPDAAASRAELAATRVELETALAEARRTADMLAHGVATERERREADLRVSELDIQLARTTTAVAIVGSGSGGTVIIRAPIAGMILSRRAAIGMTVGPNSEEALIEIGDPSALGVIADVFDRDVGAVREGAEVDVTFPTSDETFRGHVAYVAPVVTGGVRTVPVRIELDVLPPAARPGLFGRASISLVDRGIVLPASAVLVRDGDRTVVYTETSTGNFAVRDVEVGPSAEGRVYVMRGLTEGERVVVQGALLLDGASDMLL